MVCHPVTKKLSCPSFVQSEPFESSLLTCESMCDSVKRVDALCSGESRCESVCVRVRRCVPWRCGVCQGKTASDNEFHLHYSVDI